MLLFKFVGLHMKKKKFTLDSVIDYDYDLIGICSHHSDYRLMWSLNSILNIGLTKEKDLFLVEGPKKVGDMEFPSYYYKDVLDYTFYRVIKNKFGAHTLISEANNIDYFLFVQNGSNKDTKLNLMNKLRECDAVLGVFDLDPAGFNSTQYIDLN